MTFARISVITVCLNNADGLHRTIRSVVNQSYKDIEYIIIDGGSTDDSVSVIKEFEHKLSYWRSEPDNGIYNAMNKGILQARGDYLLFLNSGDWFVNEEILDKVFSEQRTAAILYGDINEISSDGSIKKQVSLQEDCLTIANFNTNTRATIQHPAAFIHHSLFTNSLFDESYKIIADIKFFIEKIILQNYTVQHLPFVITNFNLEGVSSASENWANTIEERKRIFKELLPPRIYKDYEILFAIKDSPLLKYIPFLETTTQLNRFVTLLTKFSIRLYKALKMNKF
jgi:glycosyltransferase involved in cell wall biosynthesis